MSDWGVIPVFREKQRMECQLQERGINKSFIYCTL